MAYIKTVQVKSMEQKLTILKTGFNMFEVRDESKFTIFEGTRKECEEYIKEEKRRF